MFTLLTLSYPLTSSPPPGREEGLRRLARAAASHDAAAQRRIYNKLYAYALSIALHYAGQREEAEEITQDAFVKLFRQLPKQVPTGSVRTYFGRIVVNTAIDLLRKRQREPFVEEMSEHAAAAHGTSRNAGDARLQQDEIYRLLQMLPAGYRMVFNLHVLEGYSHPEIARRLGITTGTSKSNLSKARRKLRELAAAYYQLDDNPTAPGHQNPTHRE